MLIIGRRAGESIFLGEDVEIRIIDLTPSRVKLGIVAPRELTVLRSEVRLAREQNKAAANLAGVSDMSHVVKHFRTSQSAAQTPFK